MTDTAHRNRQPAGITTGGQFALMPHTEPDVVLGPAGSRVLTMPVAAFVETFEPAEYDLNRGWDGTLEHPAFLEPNPFNPDRVHEGTWDAFVHDVRANGIREPVAVDLDTGTVTEGHHRVVAAMLTGQAVRFEAYRDSDPDRDAHAELGHLLDVGLAELE
ncbi:ParB N-terminal domain-containing protein [Pseudactinotalea terrae]|uniref:ParB N-terminal domain-containing protein n=1 Tax=Pseudactinotalea terrae TaxID=1743262 RepID=UPI0012E270B4|nr:ParB N-terminal domain-containing protein [Pseudactinotalea terrae]